MVSWRRRPRRGGDERRPPTPAAPNPEIRTLTSYAQIRSVLRDPERFTVSSRVLDCGQRRPLLPLQAEPAQHHDLRSRLDPFFTAAAIATSEARVRRRAVSLIETYLSAGGDVNAAVSRQLPVLALIDLLDLPDSAAVPIREFHDGILHHHHDADGEPDRDAVGRRVYDFFDRVVAEQRGSDGPGLIRFLQAGPDDVDGLADPDIVDICYLLVLAGIDPVANALSGMIAHLAATPAGRADLIADAVALRRTIEELLRWGSAVKVLTRESTTATEVDGIAIGAGERVACVLTAGNRDASVFGNPADFDATRRDAAHLSFGSGAHRCLGVHLARLQLRVVAEELQRLIPDFALADDAPTPVDAATIGGTDALHLVFSPSG